MRARAAAGRLFLSAACLLLISCGGGGGSSAVAPAAAPGAAAQQRSTNGSIVLSIPTQTASGAVRYPQFVSPNASSVSLVVNGGTAQTFDVSAASSLCATTSGARNCTLTFGAPPGNDTIVLTIFSGPNGTGTTLATTTTTTTVTAGTPFSVTVAVTATIGTVVATVKGGTGASCTAPATAPNPSITEGCGGSGLTGGGAGLTVNAFDPSGAQITGTAPYATPIQISANDPALSASPTSITAPGQTVSLAYTGAPLAQSLGNSATISLTIGSQVVTISVPIVRANLYVANSNALPGTTPPGNGNVEVYPFGASGSATPIRVISGGNTQLSNPIVPVLDSSGNLYVLDNGPYFSSKSHPVILVFPSGANGNVTPTRTITIPSSFYFSACQNIVLDPSGKYLILSCDQIYTLGLIVIPVSTSGTATQTANLKCATTCFSNVVGMAFDPNGNLWAAESGNNDIFSFSSGTFSLTGGTQNLTPGTQINGTTGTPWPGNSSSPPYISPLGLGFDGAGRMYVDIVYVSSSASPTNDALNRVGIWTSSALSACTNCAPSITLTGAPFTTHAPTGMTMDYAGNLYVGNQFNNSISEFAPATLTSSASGPAVLRTISTGTSPSAPTGMAIGP
jgi:hypothetical protein